MHFAASSSLCCEIKSQVSRCDALKQFSLHMRNYLKLWFGNRSLHTTLLRIRNIRRKVKPFQVHKEEQCANRTILENTELAFSNSVSAKMSLAAWKFAQKHFKQRGPPPQFCFNRQRRKQSKKKTSFPFIIGELFWVNSSTRFSVKVYWRLWRVWWPFLKPAHAMDKRFTESFSKICGTSTYCTCGCGSHSSTKREVVSVKHYKSQFFKETFSDPNNIFINCL